MKFTSTISTTCVIEKQRFLTSTFPAILFIPRATRGQSGTTGLIMFSSAVGQYIQCILTIVVVILDFFYRLAAHTDPVVKGFSTQFTAAMKYTLKAATRDFS